MKDDEEGSGESSSKSPTFQVIILGSGGGPREDNVTGLLVRSVAENWAKGSVLAVDAGTHLAAIVRILESSLPQSQLVESAKGSKTTHGQRSPLHRADAVISNPSFPNALARIHRTDTDVDNSRTTSAASAQRMGSMKEGPFADLELPHESARANAAFITRELVSTYLITHPHLDHISGFVVNTASFQHTSRPKRLAGLPSTIHAIKTHIFNDVIWPNLSDEDGGVGLMSYRRLTEGEDMDVGDGESEGYTEVCNGLCVKGWSISHGHCMKTHSHRGSNASLHTEISATATAAWAQEPLSPGPDSDRLVAAHARSSEKPCVYDSTAFFIRDKASGREVLIFGDVEPDSLSLSPRTARVWEEAAPKIVAGALTGIFIECSFDDTQSDPTLYGHLAPRHLIDELKVLASKVEALRQAKRKRKRHSFGLKLSDDADARNRRTRNPHCVARRSQGRKNGTSDSSSQTDLDRSNDFNNIVWSPGESPGLDRAKAIADDWPLLNASVGGIFPDPSDLSKLGYAAPPTHTGGGGEGSPSARPLEGLPIVIIHMKDTLRDGHDIGQDILESLESHDLEAGLGCNFTISKTGASFWL
ncbi:MAG: 3',5'-cyclic-nucleotide phosphodiesterase pde1 [Geoglossum simile]|nr:MAG: 3',5'-cyclic-nucleotide phosphodiesterase pde1 [Geoglossum simile]